MGGRGNFRDHEEAEFTIGTSTIRCVVTRPATNQVGGFAQHAYISDAPVVIANRTHRFSLRRNRTEMANCFLSATEVWVTVANDANAANDDTAGGEGASYNGASTWFPITFSETEDPRIIKDGAPLFTGPPDELQIFAECCLCADDQIKMRKLQVFHFSLSEMMIHNVL